MAIPPAIEARVDVVRQYLAALDASDTAKIVELFHPRGEVISPLLGRMDAVPFFENLARSSKKNDITVMDVLPSLSQPRVASYFRYRWTLPDDAVIQFDCCDIFDFAADVTPERIKLMTIVYDTAPIRADVGSKYGRGVP